MQPAGSAYPPPPPPSYADPAAPPGAKGGMAQQQYGQPAPAAGHAAATTVIIQQPGAMMAMPLGANPALVTCAGCNNQVTTVTSKKCGGYVWMWAGIICLIGLLFSGITWVGCCLIPFCIPQCYNTDHTCPNCGRPCGTYSHNMC